MSPGEAVDVTGEVWRELVGVVQELRQVQFREVVEGPTGDVFEQAADDRIWLGLDLGVFRKHLGLGRSEQAVEAPQYGQGKDD